MAFQFNNVWFTNTLKKPIVKLVTILIQYLEHSGYSTITPSNYVKGVLEGNEHIKETIFVYRF